MIQTKTAPGGRPGAAERRRNAGALPLPLYSTREPPKSQEAIPPDHLAEQERVLWLRAEAVKDADPVEYRGRRRALLLAQDARYGT